MKKLLTLVLLCINFSFFAKSDRSFLDPALATFYHGVAYGDLLPDRFIIWTRVTLDPPVDPVTVSWQMTTDTLSQKSQ